MTQFTSDARSSRPEYLACWPSDVILSDVRKDFLGEPTVFSSQRYELRVLYPRSLPADIRREICG